jgi:hypothetical protein
LDKKSWKEAIAGGLAPITRAYESLSVGDVSDLMARNGAIARERAEAEMIPIRKAVGIA